MGQKTPIQKKSPIDGVWDIARSNIDLSEDRHQPDSTEVKRETARIRSKIEQSGIGDRAVYDETRAPTAQ